MAYLLGREAFLAVLDPSDQKPMTRWSRTVANAELFVSVMTIGEIEHAIQDLPPQRAAARRRYTEYLDTHVPRVFSQRVLPVTVEVAREAGRVQQRAKTLGAAVSVEEAVEIATARLNGYTYVSERQPHHRQLGVNVEDCSKF